ncbi:MAG: ribose 5-phosphate isomerase B [Phycisphaerae bacterium]
MNIALACDHRGFNIKLQLIEQLRVEGHGAEDFGAFDAKACDYPDFAVPASLAIVEGKAQLAILLDGSGIGMSIVANKIPGIRAAICHDELTAEISRRYNDANVLCLAVDLLGGELIRRIVSAWLKAPFEDGRHARRVEKIGELEHRLFSDIPGALSKLKSN